MGAAPAQPVQQIDKQPNPLGGMVMDRRILCVGFAVLASSFMLLTGVASARGASPTLELKPGACKVNTLPSFVAQGEFGSAATVGDVIEVSCDPYVYSNGAEVEVTATEVHAKARPYIMLRSCGGLLCQKIV